MGIDGWENGSNNFYSVFMCVLACATKSTSRDCNFYIVGLIKTKDDMLAWSLAAF